MDGHPFREAPAETRLAGTRVEPASRRRGFLFMLLFSTIWNAISWIVFLAILASDTPWIVFAFLSIFLLVGVIVIGVTIHAGLALFNPVVEIYISTPEPALGDMLEVTWRVLGRSSRIRGLDVEIKGLEEATYRRGTDTTTDTATFFHERLARTRDPREIAGGRSRVVIPAGAVPSFAGSHNAIHWKITVAGDIPRWPDIDDTFTIKVIAKQARTRRAA